jgi:hypothetical protein
MTDRTGNGDPEDQSVDDKVPSEPDRRRHLAVSMELI